MSDRAPNREAADRATRPAPVASCITTHADGSTTWSIPYEREEAS
jgi:hypothetical protein